MSRGYWKEAIAELDEAARLAPRSTQILIMRGQAKIELREYAAAIDDLHAAEQISPAEFTRHDLLVRAYLAESDSNAAIKAATAGLASQPSNAELLVLRAQAFLDNRQFAEAEQDADAALTVDERNARGLFLRGSARLQLGKYPEAAADLDQTIHHDSHNATAYWLRAQVRDKLNEPMLAESDRTRARELDPSLNLTDSSAGDSLLKGLQNSDQRETLDSNLK